MDRRSFIGLTVALGALGPRAALAGKAPVYSEDGVAIRGADSVAYFRGDGAVAGTLAEPVRWRGAVWLFATRENREAFELDPRRFAPRFGGYCAYTLSQGGLHGIDPRAYAIHEERLYLVSSLAVREIWLEDLERNIALAEENWPKVLG